MQGQKSSVVIAAALVALASAGNEKRQTLDVFSQSCPGVLNVVDASTFCCVGGTLSIPPLQLSSCAGWPICTGPVTISASSTPDNPPQTCATIIDANDPNYSSAIASATASIAASGINAATTIFPTESAAAPGSSASGSSQATASSASSRTTASSSAATSSAAANMGDMAGVPGAALSGVAAAWGFGLVAFLL